MKYIILINKTMETMGFVISGTSAAWEAFCKASEFCGAGRCTVNLIDFETGEVMASTEIDEDE
ncbi:MAG: hypothetical protein VZR09_10240 [Candidatus Gastranaerophilaceae bacterium]|nr:hypothetical protein [Candidatus Gastranaerophilaceae bacterium]